jgi:small subunit ribosomal protein S1
VEAVILGVNLADRRISLGLKQALGNPWALAAENYPVGSVVEGPVTSLTNFGAFVQLVEGVEGMIHVGNISAEKRINHPQDVLRVGQTVRAQVLEFDRDKRRISLGMKQLVPTGLDEYLAEHKPGDLVSGRIVEISGTDARVELGEGIHAICRITAPAQEEKQTEAAKDDQAKLDLSSLTSMLNARWKGTSAPSKVSSKAEAASAGQIRSFRIAGIDPAAKKIQLELA